MVSKHTIKTLRRINREDPSLKTKPTQVIKDRRTKRNRTRSAQNRKAISDSIS